jgi:hypothetical protein
MSTLKACYKVWRQTGLKTAKLSKSRYYCETEGVFLIGIAILIPMGKVCDTIVDIDYKIQAFTYTLVRHWSGPSNEGNEGHKCQCLNIVVLISQLWYTRLVLV